MFKFDNTPTQLSRTLTHIVERSALNLNSNDSNSHTCTIYRTDPLDQYPFITVHAGLKYVEPIYGPLAYNDQSGVTGTFASRPDNPFCFQVREGIQWHEDFPEPGRSNWRIHLSG